MSRIVVIDGQGGGVGKSLVDSLKRELPSAEIIAVGTNAMATLAMLKSGADAGATGENAVIYNAGEADIITGPIGIIFANSILGEITPSMAKAVSESKANKVLIPISKCHAYIVGIAEKTMSQYIDEAISVIKKMVK